MTTPESSLGKSSAVGRLLSKFSLFGRPFSIKTKLQTSIRFTSSFFRMLFFFFLFNEIFLFFFPPPPNRNVCVRVCVCVITGYHLTHPTQSGHLVLMSTSQIQDWPIAKGVFDKHFFGIDLQFRLESVLIQFYVFQLRTPKLDKLRKCVCVCVWSRSGQVGAWMGKKVLNLNQKLVGFVF